VVVDKDYKENFRSDVMEENVDNTLTENLHVDLYELGKLDMCSYLLLQVMS